MASRTIRAAALLILLLTLATATPVAGDERPAIGAPAPLLALHDPSGRARARRREGTPRPRDSVLGGMERSLDRGAEAARRRGGGPRGARRDDCRGQRRAGR